MPFRPPQTEGDLRMRIIRAAVTVVMNNGTRQAKSAQIAAAADTSESTMFRHFKDIESIFQAVYDYSWGLLNQHIYDESFEHPVQDGPVEALAAEFDSIWGLLDGPADPGLRAATTIAFTYLRRPLELGRGYESPNQRKFQNRILLRCKRVVTARGSDVSPESLQEVLTGFAATVWLTHELLPTAAGGLSPELARLGVLGLIDRLTSNSESSGR